MKNEIKNALLILFIAFISSCKEDDDETITPSTPVTSVVSVGDFSTTTPENPANGTSLGFIQATVNDTSQTLNYSWFTPTLGLDINLTTGELTVSDSSYYDYEKSAFLKAIVVAYTESNSNVFDTAQVIINLTNVLEPAEMSVQMRLNNGQTPFEIYQSNNSLLDSLYGKTFEGGLIFYLNTTDGTGLLAAETDQGASIAWDTTSNAFNQIATGAQSDAIGDGVSNTRTIVQALSGLGMYAAKTCDDLMLNSKSDWFLPSENEMNEMYTNLHAKGLGNFSNERYWSSTEFDLSPTGAAMYRNFDTSSSQTGGTSPKTATNYVRAARAF